MSTEGTVPKHALKFFFGMMGDMYSARSVSAIVNLGIPDALKDGPATAEEIAEKLNLHAPSLFRVMRAATYRDVLTVDPITRKFELTETGRWLTSDDPNSMAEFIKMTNLPAVWKTNQYAEHSVRTGGCATEVAFGKNIWEYYREQPDELATFMRGMTCFSVSEVNDILGAYPFREGDAQLVVDVGGGHGTILGAILDSMPTARGIVFDLPQVIGDLPADSVSKRHDRIECVGGSFFTEIPAGGDIYILKHILHDWYDTECVTILKNVAKAMNPGSRLLVCETPLKYGPEGKDIVLMDLSMLIMIGGKERSVEEYESLFNQAGLKLSKVAHSDGGVSVLEAKLE